MAGRAGHAGHTLPGKFGLLAAVGGNHVIGAAHLVRVGGMAIHAIHARALLGQVDVLGTRRLKDGVIQVTVLGCVSTTPEEVAYATVPVAGRSDFLGDFSQRDTGIRPACFLLFVVTGCVMANQAVDVLLLGEVEGLVLEAIARVAARAGFRVPANDGDAIVVHQVGGLSVAILAVFGHVPGPVRCGHDLLGCLGMAGQAGSGHRRAVTVLERALEDLELAVISREASTLGCVDGRVGTMACGNRWVRLLGLAR